MNFPKGQIDLSERLFSESSIVRTFYPENIRGILEYSLEILGGKTARSFALSELKINFGKGGRNFGREISAALIRVKNMAFYGFAT